jgi:SPP1 family predicted phage head-tail adaptor
MMRGGALDERITIERATFTSNTYGEPIQTWAVLATVWASREDVSDGERWRAAEVSATISHRFRIRFSNTVADVNPKDRIRFDGRVFDIHHVKELGRRAGLELTASARAD